MAQRIQIARAWCDECLRDCFQSYDESTGKREHIGPETQDLGKKTEELKARGYQVSHRAGVFTFTLWKAAPLALPLEWQMLIEEHEKIDRFQDW